MSRKVHRVDLNQSSIVGIFLKFGFSVFIASSMGDGFPDLVVGFCGLNFLVEIKNRELYSKNRVLLTDDQLQFHGNWKGSIVTIETDSEAIEFCTRVRKLSKECYLLIAGVSGKFGT